MRQYIFAKMHMMVTVESRWKFSIETAEFIELGLHDIIEVIYQAGMK